MQLETPRSEEWFIGREVELDAARTALERGGCVTLKGSPGVGKSTLARVLLRRVRGVVRVWCDGDATLLSLATSLASAAEVVVRSDDVRVVLQRLTIALDAKCAVICFDGPGSATEIVTAFVNELLLATANVRVVVCSSNALGLPMEHVVHVAPLSFSSARSLLEATLSRYGVAAHGSSTEALTVSSGGSPLAIELLAGRVAAFGAETVVDQLRRDVSVSFVSDDDRSALAALCVFREPFTAEAGAFVVDDASLMRLCASSLVHVHEAGLLRVLEPIRDEVASEIPDDARRRHCEWCLRSPSASRTELLAAWSWASATDSAQQLALRLDPLLLTQGSPTLHREVLTRSLQADGEPTERIDLLLALARLDIVRGQHRLAAKSLEEARTLAEDLKDHERAGRACALACSCFRHLGELPRAMESGRRALTIAKTLEDFALMSLAEQALGSVMKAGELDDDAARAFKRAAAAARVAQSSRLQGIAAASRSVLLLEQRRLVDAAQSLEDARVAFAAAGDSFHLAWLSADEAALAVLLDVPSAGALVDAAIEATRAVGAFEGELRAREVAVLHARTIGDARLVTRRLDELSVAAERSDDVSWPARIERLRANDAAS